MVQRGGSPRVSGTGGPAHDGPHLRIATQGEAGPQLRAPAARAAEGARQCTQREVQWVADAMELLRCADTWVHAEQDNFEGSFPHAAVKSDRLQRFDGVLKQRLDSMRFLADQQAKLRNMFDERRARLKEDQGRDVAALKQLERGVVDAELARLASIQADIADKEQQCIEETRARQSWIEGQQMQVDECLRAVNAAKEVRAVHSAALVAAGEALAATEQRAAELRASAADLEARGRAVELREVALRCLEAGWEAAVAQCRAKRDGGPPRGQMLRLAAEDCIAAELLGCDRYLSQLRESIHAAVRASPPPNQGAVRPPSGRRPEAALGQPLEQQSGSSANWHGEDERASVASTADLEELPGSPHCSMHSEAMT